MDLVNQPFTEKGQKTLDALVEASRRNFYTKGYYKTTVKDITKDAGVSVGAFYLYFEDKLSVYKYLVTTYGKFIRAHISEHIKASDSRKVLTAENIKTQLENQGIRINLIKASFTGAFSLFCGINNKGG